MFSLMPYVYGRDIDPFREFEKLEKEFFTSTNQFGFKTDVYDLGDKFLLEAELPGFKKENINVEVENGKLTISAERSSENNGESGSIIHRERAQGFFVRSFDISAVSEDEIKGTFNDGVLSLELPKKKEQKPKTRKIEL